jgi:hypothetical protein
MVSTTTPSKLGLAKKTIHAVVFFIKTKMMMFWVDLNLKP